MEREKNTKAITSSRVLLHVLLTLYDLVTCALLFLVYFPAVTGEKTSTVLE